MATFMSSQPFGKITFPSSISKDLTYLPSIDEVYDHTYSPSFCPIINGQRTRQSMQQVMCGNCYHRGHEVRSCRHPQQDGYIHGCVICNSPTHLTTSCEADSRFRPDHPTFRQTLLLLALKWRACLPPLLLHIPYTEIPGFATLKVAELPWTPAFSKANATVYQTLSYKYQDNGELVNDPSSKIVDPIWASGKPHEIEILRTWVYYEDWLLSNFARWPGPDYQLLLDNPRGQYAQRCIPIPGFARCQQAHPTIFRQHPTGFQPPSAVHRDCPPRPTQYASAYSNCPPRPTEFSPIYLN